MNDSAIARKIPPKSNIDGEKHSPDFHEEQLAKHAKSESVTELHVLPPDNPSSKKPAQRPWVWALVGAAAIALTAVGITYYIHSLSFENTDDAFIDGHITSVSSRVSGHVAKIYIEDNQLVKEGDLLAELDPADFDTRLAAAEAAAKAAQATLSARNTAITFAQSELEQGKAELIADEARELLANARLKRIESLVPAHAASQESLDEAIAAAHVAHADVTAAKEKLNSKQSAIEQAKSGAAAAESVMHQAEAELNQAKLNRSYTKIYAPISGHVTRKSVELGAFIQVGQLLMALVDPNVWVVANFKETQLAKMQPGQPVTVTIDTNSGVKFSAHVDSIQRGSGARFSLLPPENATGNYVKVVQRVPVKIVFDDLKQIEQYALGPGMSVVPTVKIDEPGRPSISASKPITSR